MKRALDRLLVTIALVASTASAANAAAFAPSDLSNLSLWLNGDAGVTQSSGNVSLWSDQSGSGNHLAQGTSAVQPSLASGAVNGHDAVSFSTNGAGTADNEYLTNSTLQLNTTSTVFFVLNPDVLGAGSAQRFAGHYSNGQFRFNNSDASMFTSGGNADLTNPNAMVGQFQVLTYRINGTVQTAINNANLVQTRATSSFDASPFFVGGVRNTFAPLNEYGSFDGDIAEVIVYDRVLSTEEVNHVGAYLAAKYNLGASFVGRDEKRVVYNFNTLNASDFPGTQLVGQDNWTGSTTQTVRTGDPGIDGTAMGFGSGTDGQVVRQNDASFSFLIPDQSTFLFEFDARVGNTRNMEVGLVDAANNVILQVGGQGTTLDAWRLRAPGGDFTSTNLFPAVSSDYYHLLLRVDLAANNGDGAAWLFVADLNGDGVSTPSLLTAVSGLQGINLGLGAIDGEDLTGIYFRGAAGGGVDNIAITFYVPAPAALPAGLGMLTLLAMRRRR